MTTVAQVREVVAPLLQRNSDLALIGRLIIIKPVHHLLCGVHIDRSLDPLSFVPTWSVILLPVPQKRFGFLWGDRVRGSRGTWQTIDPDISSTMCDAIEKEALAPMRSVKTFDDFINLAATLRNPERDLGFFPIDRMTVDIARGDLAAAKAICEFLETQEGKAMYFFLQEKYQRTMQEICPLVTAKDRQGLAAILHSREAESVKALKIEKFWERTPFPIEMGL